MTIEVILLVASVLLFLSVVASKISDRYGVPILILFLTIGMLAGSESVGKIYFDDPWLAKTLGTVALTFILFAGGFETNKKDIKEIFLGGLSLSSLGVLLTAITVGLFSTAILKFTLMEGLLLGAIVSSTDAAAVFNVLRANKIKLKGNLQPLLEFESGSNDPMAVFLTVGIIGLLKDPQLSPFHLLPDFIMDMGIGTLSAFIFGGLGIALINHLRLTHNGLYPALIIALVFFTYAVTTMVKGNGFLAVYVTGILIGNANIIHKKTIQHFCDGIAWLMQIAMFLTLGLLVFPSRIIPVINVGVFIALFLIFFARPLSVFISLTFTKFNIREKLFISWVGLRGAVPIILATFPLLAHIPKADLIFNIVFFIVLTSVLFQGTTLPIIAKLLNLIEPFNPNNKYPFDLKKASENNANLENFIVPYDSVAIGKPLYKLNIPKGCLIALISRDETFLVPNGETKLEAGDVLLIIADKEDFLKVHTILSSKKI